MRLTLVYQGIIGAANLTTNLFVMSGSRGRKNLIFMGLDLSLTSTGVSVGGTTFSIKSKLKGVQRLVEISEQVVESAKKLNPVVVIIEGYSYGSKFSRAHALGELGGAVKVGLHLAGFRIVEVPPKCRAKFATGNGNASKGDVMAFVAANFPGLFAKTCGDDEYDAWILEQMGYAQIGECSFKWSNNQLLGLKKVDWIPLYEALGGKIDG